MVAEFQERSDNVQALLTLRTFYLPAQANIGPFQSNQKISTSKCPVCAAAITRPSKKSHKQSDSGHSGPFTPPCQRNSPAAFMRIETTAQLTPRPLGLFRRPLAFPNLWVGPYGGP